jgi:hypothetical protein
MHENLERLQQVFLGEAVGEVSARLLSMRDPATRTYDPPVSVQVSYAIDGFLVVSDQELSNRRDELTSWTDGTVFSNETFAFFPWNAVGDVDVEVPDDAPGFTDLIFSGELPFAATLRVSDDDADELVSYAVDWEGIRTRQGDENWHTLVTDISTVLSGSPFLEYEEIIESLQAYHQWESVPVDEVIDILWQPWFKANAIVNLWFHSLDVLAEYEEGGDEFADLILGFLRDEPYTAAGLLEAVLEDGTFESTQIEDIYDVLYSSTMPTFKRTLAWYSTEDEEESE